MTRTGRGAKWAAIVAAVALVAGVASVSARHHDTTTITAQFDNANGLFRGNAVEVLGMRVGKVTGIHAHGTAVEVTLSVDASVRVPADAQAVIVSDSILTDRHVELTPVYRGGPVLPDHAVLDLAHTKTPVEFDSLLAMADKLSKSLGGDGQGDGPIADLMNIGAAATGGNGDHMRAALTELSQALQLGPDDGAATGVAITNVVKNLDELSSAAARNDTTLRQFGSAVRQLSDLLAGEDLGEGDAGAELNAILGQVTDLMQQNRAQLKGLLANSTGLTKALADNTDNLADFLDVFPLIIDNTYNAIDTKVGALRATFDLNRALLDGQMLKDACNLLGLKELGCATGSWKDMGPDFGITDMLGTMAGVPAK